MLLAEAKAKPRQAKPEAAKPAASRHPAITAFYQRLITGGKLPKVALVVCMRKPLTMLNAMVRSNTPWDNSLHRT
ncbi:hypothetical protein WS70_24035 [Burkholderia mayonis]|uniref:Transposase n=1 Tax=Burkholderia mayonis TaxID=1385591 RepID=A0A1B4FMF1_9BURK|nr:hypothetical protein WS70_24035 [Burkholderia mayonis]KVE39134.1 hypothetical protein WS69_07715 [Burkholderia sp. BDU5]KVE45626.1 hypothetical protein WS70_04300 [Burkholderia mayonis]